jgi:hypothetical protein
MFPLPRNEKRLSIAGGFWDSARRDELSQEHLGIAVYPVDSRGHIGIQIRMATELLRGERPEFQKIVKLEILTSYEPLARFSRDMLALLHGKKDEALIEGDSVP